ncbi:MAG: MarR family winged helix-turn-helix transcriptional regulator [Anaerovoracaceae bacterium]
MKKGLIQTREASGDRRSREIYLTASASAVTKQLSEGIKEINEVVLADISEEEMRMMKETMEKIIDRFKAASAKTAKGE